MIKRQGLKLFSFQQRKTWLYSKCFFASWFFMFIVLYHPLQHGHILQAEVHLCLRLPKQPQASVCVSVLVDTEGLCSPCRVLRAGHPVCRCQSAGSLHMSHEIQTAVSSDLENHSGSTLNHEWLFFLHFIKYILVYTFMADYIIWYF